MDVDFDALREQKVEELGSACIHAWFRNFGLKVTGPAK